MLTRLFFIIVYLCLSSLSIHAQYEKLTTFATRAEGELKIDGILDESAWSSAIVTTGFTESEPEPNTTPSQRTEVRIIYDDKGLYVGAHMLDDDPDNILKELSVRDSRNNTDWFGITLDTYQDGLNGFGFIVTAAGVQQDYKFAGDDDDSNWDAVWQSAVSIDETGWIAEIMIPYSAIRFPSTDIQHWNLQLGRELRRTREQFYWNPIDPNFEGFISQAGHLEGITNIKSPVRLSVTPYVTGYINNLKQGNIDLSQTSTSYNAGMDLKYGINDAFTLDMTLVPDFGQVRSDNQVLNLTPFEVFFEENRQFFTEGLELFDKGGLFYTRRVGGRPLDFIRPFLAAQPDEIVIDNPSRVQLYNATKVSGRTSNGIGIGVFNAVAGETHAILENQEGSQRSIKTNPLTNYNVMVVDKNLPNNSVVSLINTNVLREGSYYDANVIGAFADLRNKSQSIAFGGKYVRSEQYVTDGDNITGHAYNVGIGKVSGVWKGQINYNEESDRYNTNDLGFLFSPNERSVGAGIAYNQPNAGEKLARYEVYMNTNYNRLYNPNVFADFQINLGTFFIYKSRNAFGGSIRLEPVETFDYFEPRDNFNSYLRYPTNWFINPFFSSDYRKTLAIDIRLLYRDFDQEDRNYYSINLEPRIRVNNQLSFFLEFNYERSNNELGYVNKNLVPSEIAEVNPDDILIGRRDRDIIENGVRAQYIFTNKQSLSLRLRHYYTKVLYNRLGTLDENGNQAAISFDGRDEQGNPYYDQNFNIFNIDMDYIWRFAPGSDIIINFKNQTGGSDAQFTRSYFENLKGLREQLKDNSLSLRIIYYLDYLYLKK